MKMAMDQCETDGIFDETGVPRLTVHDELDFSDPGGRDKAFAEMQHRMEHCMPLRVPVIAGLEIGSNWGNCHVV
jgi:DNA polymerase I-like protein with 3'-5' exonuclease and polymerase domains